jgi:hypothetical protein
MPGRFTYPPPWKEQVPIVRKLGGYQVRSERVWKISPPLRFDPQTAQPIVSCYTDYTVPTHAFGGCNVLPSIILLSLQIAIFTPYSINGSYFLYSGDSKAETMFLKILSMDIFVKGFYCKTWR